MTTTADPATEPGPGEQRAADLARIVGQALAYRPAEDRTPADAAEVQAITDAVIRLLIGAPLRSDGKLIIVALAAEAGLRRNKLTHKHTGLKDLFHALVKSVQAIPGRNGDADQARRRKQDEDLARVRAERDELRVLTQQLARVVHVLELEKHALEEANSALEQDLAARGGVTDLATHRHGRRR
ncbi:hypothetical protein RMN57_05905 [Kitasatospora sp. CM 4170]|uniref:Uncharacterized protein n=1 Tax=Kitasatospora aburaviensis TaxID=67265 RepID=A0ABW1F0A8_9ACTN|nr:hypothetical protein [Kitasatospora sp. CM 4170]WNM44280.1 hypothetical protein RMN57_05905 [Kitasatospora sp. CM 4170]